jgi:O-methyltransferase involved in polyketide biosynthesis
MIQDWTENKSYEINSSNYKLFAANVTHSESLGQKLKQFGVSSTSPTLILTECLLIYLTPDESRGVLSWTKEYFNDSPFVAVLNYEMIGPDDNFGR